MWDLRNDNARPASIPYGPEMAAIYDAAMADAALPAILEGVERAMTRLSIAPRTIADMGCGTGRLLAALAIPGRRLVGVDRSPAMLAVAKRRLRPKRALLLRQDLRALALPERVDLILCTFATINYILRDSDLDAVFAGFARHLHLGGHVILDFIPMLNEADAPIRARQDVSLGTVRSVWDVYADPARGITHTRITFRPVHGRPGRVENHIQRWHRPARVRELLQRNGLVPRLCQPLGSGGPSLWWQIVARREKRACPVARRRFEQALSRGRPGRRSRGTEPPIRARRRHSARKPADERGSATTAGFFSPAPGGGGEGEVARTPQAGMEAHSRRSCWTAPMTGFPSAERRPACSALGRRHLPSGRRAALAGRRGHG